MNEPATDRFANYEQARIEAAASEARVVFAETWNSPDPQFVNLAERMLAKADEVDRPLISELIAEIRALESAARRASENKEPGKNVSEK